jgi:hypothetical protein
MKRSAARRRSAAAFLREVSESGFCVLKKERGAGERERERERGRRAAP